MGIAMLDITDEELDTMETVDVLLFTADFDNQTIFYIAHPVRCAINLHKNIGLIL